MIEKRTIYLMGEEIEEYIPYTKHHDPEIDPRNRGSMATKRPIPYNVYRVPLKRVVVNGKDHWISKEKEE